VPEDAEVLPWPRDPRAPRGSRRTARPQRPSADPGPPEPATPRLDRIRTKAPLLLKLATEPIHQAKAAADAAQLARARRVGRDLGVVNRSDYGHGIRLGPIRAHNGVLLRDADVVVADASDPHAPKVTIRRARRTDPLVVLFHAGTIDQYHVDAGELLRAEMESSMGPMAGTARSEIHVAPFLRAQFPDRHIASANTVRRARAAIGAPSLPAVDWVLLGGPITAYAEHVGMRRTRAAVLVRDGLERLARHFGLVPVSGAR
jgi:hypothetical protein